jgi:hypothetical protein
MAGVLLSAGAAAAGPSDAEKCEADKLKRAGKHAFCLMKAQSKFVRSGDAARLASDITKCDAKITGKFAKAETRWGAECPTTGDVAAIQTRVTGDTDDLGVLLSGGMLPPVCGNGTIDAGEECDFGDLDGQTCDSLTAGSEPFGTLGCSPGACGFDTSGCFPRFEDTGLTVIDNQTGLEWEKKTGVVAAASDCPGGPDCGDLNNVNNRYTWSAGATQFDGSALTSFLDGLNDVVGGGTNCFAGRCDWRMATVAKPDPYGVVDEGEWESIVDCSGGAPCLDPAFGPTGSDVYWSSSANASGQFGAWGVSFVNGFVGVHSKAEFHYVRAVRGGS